MKKSPSMNYKFILNFKSNMYKKQLQKWGCFFVDYFLVEYNKDII